ncbi:MAG: DMT family transporter [Rhodospirillales bacterium]
MNSKMALYALGAAVLFGLSTPAAKLLVGTVSPWILAGTLYIGAGGGLALVRASMRLRGVRTEAALTRRDVPWLAAAIVAGGVAGPVLLLIGLQHTDASSASLLLTLEGVATALLAWFLFRENFDRRIAIGMAFILAGAIVLNWRSGFQSSELIGPLAIVSACLAWALDNNLTRKVSLSDPVQIAMVKGLVAGPVSLGIGLLVGDALPSWSLFAAGAAVGFLGYGVSLALFVFALRHLGTARTGAYFSTAPFIGALVAIPLFGDGLSAQLIAAGCLMGIGVWLHLTERHEHEHRHDRVEHEHNHVHDDAHHDHQHGDYVAPGVAHSHRHVHTQRRHSHAHTPDSHHRHSH